MRPLLRALLFPAFAAAQPAVPPVALDTTRIHYVAAMTALEIAALDPARTVLLLPGGVLEQHGPHLPAFTDGYLNERLADELAATVVAAKPGWHVLDSLDRFVEAEMDERRIPGLALAVVRDGSVVYARGYGVADLAHRVPATDSTAFLIASVTKTFTAVAVLMLVEEARVDLDAPVGRYVPGLPEAWRPATVRQLLQHTSGINSFSQHDRPPCSSASGPDRMLSTRDALAEVACLPLDFAPGTDWAYSDTGYLLLGLLVEAVGGQPFESFLRERIFVPLAMSSTQMLDAEAVIPHLARGYAWDGAAFRNAPELSGAVEFSTGGLVSTVHDLARWAGALGSERLLGPVTWAEAWTPVPVGDAAYGMGFALRPVGGRRHVGHTGGGPGAATALAHFPDDGLSVVVLTNGAQPPFTIRDLAGEIATYFFDR